MGTRQLLEKYVVENRYFLEVYKLMYIPWIKFILLNIRFPTGSKFILATWTKKVLFRKL